MGKRLGGDGHAPKRVNLVLVQPQIPPNTGSIGRLCLGMGVSLHLVKPLGFSLDEKAVRRAGLDYWKHVDLHVHEDLDSFFSNTQPTGARYVLTSARAGRPFHAFEFQSGDFILFGREADGLPPELVDDPPGPQITIPQRGEVRSINLAQAAAVILIEACRQLDPHFFGVASEV